MRMMYLSTVLALSMLGGCGVSPGRSVRDLTIEQGVDVDRLVAVDLGNDTVPTGAVGRSAGCVSLEELGPHPALARAVEQGVAKASGPITNGRYWRWLQEAELRVRLEGQKGRLLYLEDLMSLAETSEEDFIQRLSLDNLHTGYSPDQHLRIFGLVRNRVRGEIDRTKAEIKLLEQVLARAEPPADHIVSISGDTTMPEKTLSEFGLATAEIARLKEIGIHEPRDFVEHFYLPEQHNAVATLLGRDVESVNALISKMAKDVPEEELKRLAEEARQPRSFGVLPPDLDQKGDQQ